jgi:hypothetical protein
MKKLGLLFCVVLLSVSCDPLRWETEVPRIWNIKNYTEQTLILKFPHAEMNGLTDWSRGDFEYIEVEVSPFSGTTVFSSGIPEDAKPWFDYYFTESVKAFGEDVSWHILSEDSTVLKTWKYSDKDSSKERFFDNTEWSSADDSIFHTWIFIIKPEDLQSTDQ